MQSLETVLVEVRRGGRQEGADGLLKAAILLTVC